MSSSSRFIPGEGDWICDNRKCKNVNFAKRMKCNKCGQDRTPGQDFKKTGSEIGKQLAEKSKGLFSADDWMCKACGNVNWARRSTCNLCNAPKFGNMEPRTGYGGGYMEREINVEYKEKEAESDDEYDEFGRKKKKYRGQFSGDGILANPTESDDDHVDTSKYNLGSEEEEDDEDLSKYKLSDDDEEDKPGQSKIIIDKSRSSSTSSSSRSSSSRSPTRSSSGSRAKHHPANDWSRSRARDQKNRFNHKKSMARKSRSSSTSSSSSERGKFRRRSRSRSRS